METASTIIVNPAAAGQAGNNLLIFLDDFLNVDAAGEVITSFAPGDRIYFLVQVLAGLVLEDVRCSDGSLSHLGNVTRQQTDRLNIAEDTDSVSLSKIPHGGLTPVWYGNEGDVSLNENELTVRGPLPAVVDMSYSYRAISYLQIAPDIDLEADTTYPLMITAYTPEDSTDADNCPA